MGGVDGNGVLVDGIFHGNEKNTTVLRDVGNDDKADDSTNESSLREAVGDDDEVESDEGLKRVGEVDEEMVCGG